MNSRVAVITVGILVVLGLGAWWWARTTADPTPTAVEPLPSEPSSAKAAGQPADPAPASRPRRQWQAKRERIRARRSERGASSSAESAGDGTRELCSDACWGTLEMQLQLAKATAGCRELLPDDARGAARFQAQVIAEPDVGAVIDSVTVLDDTIDAAEFSECMVESAPLAELVDPGEPISDTFNFRFSVGVPADNAGDFLRDHPQIVEAYPELSALLEPADDPEGASTRATLFARTISEHEDAQAAFTEWFTEQGVDLSKVRVD